MALWKRRWRSGLRISSQLYAGIWAAVAFTIAAGLVGWVSFNQVGDAQRAVSDETVPAMEAAFRVAQFSSALSDAAPRLATAMSQRDLIDVAAGIAATNDAFSEQLTTLEESTEGEVRYRQLREYSEALIANIGAIYNDKVELFGLAADEERLQGELATLRRRLDDIMAAAFDTRFFIPVGADLSGEGGTRAGDTLAGDQLVTYRHLTDIQSDANLSTQLLATAFSLSDSSQIKPLRSQFEAASSRIETALATLAESGPLPELDDFFSELSTLGSGTNGGFNLVDRKLRLLDRQGELLGSNRVLAVNMVDEVDVLVNSARQRASESTLASERAILTGRSLLLAIGAICVVGAVLWAWLFVGRVILRRLSRLSTRMRTMAQGDLETAVDIEGQDEVAEMAQALEVFRRHALEVQRLNLVEQMASELGEKNSELERVLGDLQRAQEQIVVQGKLAALGELTAGVAHEIRNPLHFIKNFSEVSGDMLEEFREILDEDPEDQTEEDKEYLLEIADDLRDNLERILSHGDRANRIVEDMLMMGRGSGDKRLADLNTVMRDHMLLAYHSARALNPEFNVTIREDYDPAVGEMEVVPQDVGRVFLNLVSNACYATDQRRRSMEASGRGKFMPELRLSSRRERDRVVFSVWDNGGGIPPNIINNIFNPFFTTKPSDQGTGLGLAISSDIARQHGGFIRVETEEGESTTMVLELPLSGTPLTPAVAGVKTDWGDDPIE